MTRSNPYAEAAAKARDSQERVVFLADAELMAAFDLWAVGEDFNSRAEALRKVIKEAIGVEDDAGIVGRQEFKFRMPKDVHEWLRSEAYDRQCSMNSVVVQCIRAAMVGAQARQGA